MRIKVRRGAIDVMWRGKWVLTLTRKRYVRYFQGWTESHPWFR